jgi:EAL domain-containing protein (putative c-di-GMP-specific phosphodiesterase class I)
MTLDLAAAQARILDIALHDGETGMLNRLGLEHRLIDMLATSTSVAVAAFGFETGRAPHGDAVTTSFAGAGRWRAARLDDDVFAVAFESGDAEAAINAAREGLQAALGGAVWAGLALRSPGARDAYGLIAEAERALALARLRGAPLAIYDRSGADVAARDALMDDLAAGLKQGALTLLHQPKLHLASNRIVGVEALARWRHPTRGPVPPDLFVPMAEQTGHIRALTEWALRQAVADARAFAAAGRDLVVSVNLSAALLGDSDFAAFALREAQGARLCFEITETATIERPDQARAILAEFSRAGIALSIDDYGARLSSLAYLTTLRADEVKLDKSFVIAMSAHDARLIAAVIELAHALGLSVAAEGIEDRATLERLTAMGADVGQGDFIGAPMPCADVIDLLVR